MSKPTTIDATQAREKSQQGQAVLVCAYEDDSKCGEVLLDGAIPYSQLAARLASMSKQDEIVFYCRSADDDAERRAAELRDRGYENTRVLLGGAEEWKLSGHPMAGETAPENPPAARA